ncbi:MAG TPA: HD domain-containing protein [Candidatus Sumerlaeia bacterium]|nr:HD domain-containing protein [Candidatus Sumerlaeia bacterium]
MKHVPLSSLQVGFKIESVYLIKDVDKKTKKNGEPYVSLTLQDNTGTINAIMWDDVDSFLNNRISTGDFIFIRASINEYNKQIQAIISEVKKIDISQVEVEKFQPASSRPIPEMKEELSAFIKRVEAPHLQSLLQFFFGDEQFMAAFMRAPAARNMHQAYIGGLAEHTIGVIKNALALAANYEGVDVDLLITGALLHDACKIYDYSFTTAITTTDMGRLIGHLALMSMKIEAAVSQIPDFPEEAKMLLEHMILSHHGKKEYGSPRLPVTAEALILFYADYADAYLSTYFEERKMAHQKGQKWTDYVEMFQSYLYAGEPPKPEETIE